MSAMTALGAAFRIAAFSAALLAGPAGAATIKTALNLPHTPTANRMPTAIEAIPALVALGYAPEYSHNGTASLPYARNVWDAPNSHLHPSNPSAVFSFVRRGTAVYDLGADQQGVDLVLGTPGKSNVFTFFDDGAEVFRFTGDQIAAQAGVDATYSVYITVTKLVFDVMTISAIGGGPSAEFSSLTFFAKSGGGPRNSLMVDAPAAIAAVPLPAPALLLLAGLSALGLRRRG